MPDPQQNYTVISAVPYQVVSSTPVTPDTKSAPESSFLDSAVNFTKNFAARVNPLPVLKQLYDDTVHPTAESSGESALLGPLGPMAVRIGKAQVEQFKKAKDAYDQGRMSEAVGHTIAGALPLVGPAAADAGEQIGSGDISGGLGSAAALIAPFGAADAMGAVKGAVGSVVPAVADIADRLGTQKMTRVLAPSSGANKARFGDMAAEAAPDVARDPKLAAWSKMTLADKLGTATDTALSDLNATYDQVPDSQRFDTRPVVKAIQDQIASLKPTGYKVVPGGLDDTAGAVVGTTGADGFRQDTLTGTGKIQSPTAVSPANSAARLDALQQALSEVKQLGDSANIDNLRKLAKSWSLGAKPQYLSNTAADALKSMGSSAGWADADQALRGYMVDQVDPPDAAGQRAPGGLAEKNARYSLMRSASDAMDAAQSADQTKAAMGRSATRTMQGAGVGALAGLASGHVEAGAALGGVLSTVLDQASNAGYTTQIATARALAKLADTLRGFQAGKASGGELQGAVMNTGLAARIPPAMMPSLLSSIRGYVSSPQQKDQ